MNFVVLGAFLFVALAIGLWIQSRNDRSATPGAYGPADGTVPGAANPFAGKRFYVAEYQAATADSGESFTLVHGFRAKTAVLVHLTVDPDGLSVRIGEGPTTTYPLREVLSVHQKTTHVSLNGYPAETKFVHTITFADGLSLTARGEFKDPARVSKHADSPNKPELRYAAFIADLERRTAELAYPAAVASLRQSNDISFGELTLGKAGVTSQSRVIPWSAITDCTAANGRLTIDSTRGQRIHALLEQLPNLTLLLALLANRADY